MVAASIATAALVRIGEMTNRTFTLPMAILCVTSRCNSRCLSCDWWRHTGSADLTLEEVGSLAGQLSNLGVRLVLFSGGEPLLRSDVFDLARQFRDRGVSLHLLTSGILLERFAERVAEYFARVCVSLDAADSALYERVRGVAALQALEAGVARLRQVAPALKVTARSTLHRHNFRELPKLIEHAKCLALDGISFLPADISSTAFGRQRPRGEPRWDQPPEPLALNSEEAAELEATVERTIDQYAGDFESGFVAESPDKLRRIPAYYQALAGKRPFPPVSCNAPWVSIVIEANGSVRPCFFHEPIGNVRQASVKSIVDRNLRVFRADLSVGANPVCARCVCSLKTGWRSAPWLS
jgi:MoaA/NifB/PqqE/SkfB family radical SAM enzyme